MDNIMNNKNRYSSIFIVILILFTIINFFFLVNSLEAQEPDRASTLPDLSGLAWIEGDLFLGIHDAKNYPGKENWPRVSLVHLPQSELQGVTWREIDFLFTGPNVHSSDMESACRIPHNEGFLFVESGQEGAPYQRIFYAKYDNDSLQIKSHIIWPVEVKNVEATEVCQVGDRLIFLYAERAEGCDSTKLRWAMLSLAPFRIGEFEEITYESVDPIGKGARPIVAMDIDNDGFIFIVSAYDSGSNNGPFRSVVWRIGKITEDEKNNPMVILNENKRIANLDGLKVESLAIRETDETKQIFVGTDDENYGGIIRLLPVPD